MAPSASAGRAAASSFHWAYDQQACMHFQVGMCACGMLPSVGMLLALVFPLHLLIKISAVPNGCVLRTSGVNGDVIGIRN